MKGITNYLTLGKRIFYAICRRVPYIYRPHYLLSAETCVVSASSVLNEQKIKIQYRHLDTTLIKRLGRFGVNLYWLENNERIDLCAIFANLQVSTNRYEELKKQLKQSPAELLPCREWLRLYELCCFRGRYTLAQIFREKARILAVRPLKDDGVKPPISWANTIGASIEGGECESRKLLDTLLERAGVSVELAAKFRTYFSLINEAESSFDLNGRARDSEFASFLKGKSVALVGPAPSNAFDAGEIDGHDVVVRLNHSFDGKGTDFIHKGIRTDITCFNGEQADALINERGAILPAELKWACFKSAAKIPLIKKTNPGAKIRCHVSFQGVNSTQFHGNFNMIPLVCLDFSLFNARTIKIYHADLMLTIRRQDGYYPESFEREKKLRDIFLIGSVSHDPIQQFYVLSRLFETKKISGDLVFSRVMNMGLERYLIELESAYKLQ